MRKWTLKVSGATPWKPEVGKWKAPKGAGATPWRLEATGTEIWEIGVTAVQMRSYRKVGVDNIRK